MELNNFRARKANALSHSEGKLKVFVGEQQALIDIEQGRLRTLGSEWDTLR